MVGKDLAELKLRSRFHISVFLVKSKHGQNESQFITPHASYVFQNEDVILISGTEKDIQNMKNNA